MNPPQPYRDLRPWGEELWLARGGASPSMVKLITVKADEALSLQFHHKREEWWIVVSGSGEAQIGDGRIELAPGVSCFVPKGAKHRVIGGADGLSFVELAYGEYDEADIVRLEDRYGRR